MLNNNLSWINLNASSGGGTGGVTDYNDLANRPIKSLTGTSQNPLKLWTLSTGLYLLNGYVNYDVNNSRECIRLFVSITAQMQGNEYVLSAFIPSWEAHYEYKKASGASTEYTEHQMLKMLTQDEVLTMTNEAEYTPSGDYNPSTKKYVDDTMEAVMQEFAKMGVNEKDIQSLIAENRRRDIAIQALLNETADKKVTIEEETHIISLDYSVDEGFATVDSLEGSTLVNVSSQKGSVSISSTFEEELTYLYASTLYTVQFEADNNTTVDITLGGATLTGQAVVCGVNNIRINTPSTLVDNKLIIRGYGNCRISNVVVTNSSKEFEYFEGMKSSFEDVQNEDGTYNVEIVVYNAPVRFGNNE